MTKIESLERDIKNLYNSHATKLPFHGLHHIIFVYEKSKIFAKDLGADLYLTSIAALTHDLNYLVKIQSNSSTGEHLRNHILSKNKVGQEDIEKVERIIFEASTSNRNENISLEAKALSDGDTLFKSLPITPIIFAGLYAQEQNITINDLAVKIINDQVKLMEKGIYFYSKSGDKYLKWAKDNLAIWQNVIDYYKSGDDAFFKEFNNKI